MSENQTKKGKCSSWLTEAASYGAEPVEPVPNRFIRLRLPAMVLNRLNWFKTDSSARMSENQTKKVKCSSWLTEAASYVLNQLKPVPNQFIRLGRKDDEEGEKAYEDEEDKVNFPSPKCPRVLCSPILSPFILIPLLAFEPPGFLSFSTEIPFISMGTTPLITSLRLTRPAHSLQFFQLASPPRIHMDMWSLFIVPVLVQCPRLSWREVDPYHRATIDGFTVDFSWSAYHLCGFDSRGIDRFELENGYSAK
ncbi:hypothetical protein CK203_103974 [Vitis vinifera]|uniref:Uncharacterized protein n=1 Tax=Vitis vinifera TaxID=29760 RepID=A0A438FIM3_VITVI|nr:hypothetical protein CK203_103974 [Vitis vinifera]